MVKRLFFVAAMLALASLQIGECMAAINGDPAAMQCCQSMPCTPANHNQGCCKNMVSTQARAMLPGHHASLHSPAVAAIEYPPIAEHLAYAPEPSPTVPAPQHSPPELYTLHSSLLI
ncbi:MAG TPA: hypothetical protein VGU63_08755 [Candidatus Acidoferrales bacterium]|nr:hypothetical protein [Candidatus Acidoferrales bacterium]